VRNIELKARLRDRERAVRVCQELGAQFHGHIRQRDTYFRVPEGRLKLRESDPGEDYLVFYRRPDTAAAKACDYSIHTVHRSVRAILSEALGELAVVDKVRTLYLWENVRIHLDGVSGLGKHQGGIDFIEFEAVLSDTYDDADGHAKLERLQEAFGIAPEDLIETSYLELALAHL
jgi:predicted adenylyl cyclase CyaB